MLRRQNLGAAHIGLEGGGDLHRPVRLEVVLQQGDEHTGGRGHGVVQRVGQVAAALPLHPHFQPPGLGVAQVGAGAHLEIFLLPGGPGLNVAGLHLQVRQIPGAALQLADRDVQGPEQLHAVPPHLLVPVHGVLGPAHHDHLLLLELVDAVHPPLLNAVGALLLPEAGGVGGQGLGQAVLGDDLVDELADHGVLRGADEVEILPLDLIHHGVHVRLAHDALHHVAVDHEGGDAEGEALADHEVPGVGQHRLVEAGDVPHQVVEPGPGHPARRVHVHPVKGLHDLGVVGDVEVGHHRLPEPLHLHVLAVVPADGHGGVDEVGDLEHDLPDLRRQLVLQLFQLRQTVGVGLHLGLGLLRLRQLGGVLFRLPHQHTHLLGQLVPLRAQVVGLSHGVPVPAVQLDDLIHQGELALLELLFDVFLDDLRVVPEELDV